MPLPVIYQNDYKIYNVSGYDRSKLPEWILLKHRRKLKKDPEYSHRIDLIQDFEFPEASIRVSFTPDEKYIVCTGVYKPQIRVYELDQLSLKFERHTNSENINFKVLESDWTKLVLLQADRSIEFHTQGGIYFSTRIPKFGRDLMYDKSTCDVLTVGSGSEVYRLNLDQGRFLKPWETSLPSINCLKMSALHRLVALGGDNGTLEYWDPRYRKVVGGVCLLEPCEITSLEYLSDGLTIAVGNSRGVIDLYDLRNGGRPFFTEDHQYGFPIKNIVYESSKRIILSADKKVVKLWSTSCEDKETRNKVLASIEPSSAINDLCHQPNTGLFILANDGVQLQSFYMPALGPAPKWCSFLDNLTEELEESHGLSSTSTLYDNYKFITKSEIMALGLDHLIGTNVLRAYMHGYFVDYRLYEKAKSIANPFAYEEYKQKKIKEEIEKERATRISTLTAKSLMKRLPKVNKALAEKLLNTEKKKTTTVTNEANPLEDDRFKDIFQNPDFEIDKESKEWKLLHPSGVRTDSLKTQAVDMDSVSENEENLIEYDTQSSENEDQVHHPSRAELLYPSSRQKNFKNKKKQNQKEKLKKRKK